MQDGERAVGRSRIEKRQNGCLISETWAAANGETSQSTSYFNPASGAWRQDWVGGYGASARFDGELRGAAMYFRGQRVRPDGTIVLARITLEPLPNGRIHHLIEFSADGDQSWSTHFSGTYVPASDQESVAAVEEPSEVVPARDPATDPRDPRRPGTSVRRLSALATEAGRAAPIEVESPIVLRFPIGPVHELPKGYAWSTTEVARYVCKGASIRHVQVEHKDRKGGAVLEVELGMHSSRMLQHVAVGIDLLHGNEVVASAALDRVSLGNAIPTQAREGTVRKSLDLKLEAAVDTLFTNYRRPDLRVTLSLP